MIEVGYLFGSIRTATERNGKSELANGLRFVGYPRINNGRFSSIMLKS